MNDQVMRNYAYYAQSGLKTKVLNAFRSIFRIGPLERALRRRTMGRDPGSFWGKLVPPEYTYPKGSWRMVEWDGLQLRLDLSNANDHGAFFALNGTVDEPLLKRLRPGDTVLDIGGNIGIYALTMAKCVKAGKVITFEPDPKNFARLGEHITMNPGLNVVARSMGVGAEEATHRLYQVVDSNSGMNRIVTAVDLKSQFPYTDVRVAPLSAALRDIPVDRIDVIKIDVEGFEGAVLRGSEDVIRRFKPVLFIELDDDNLLANGDSARALIDHVEAMGYRVLDGQTELPISATRDLAHCQFDILCLPNS
jgi:hypothetical protein